MQGVSFNKKVQRTLQSKLIFYKFDKKLDSLANIMQNKLEVNCRFAMKRLIFAADLKKYE